ncbi:hypothetical protein [Acrocarpospora catenulata]|uniref:hypothetical protein n=1 Tax=Acrocarpospora catenulata TaxID=2836182 RepID=UPI001BDAE165|nr:hypothetical protein [Acrocarpospora catenulata]
MSDPTDENFLHVFKATTLRAVAAVARAGRTCGPGMRPSAGPGPRPPGAGNAP